MTDNNTEQNKEKTKKEMLSKIDGVDVEFTKFGVSAKFDKIYKEGEAVAYKEALYKGTVTPEMTAEEALKKLRSQRMSKKEFDREFNAVPEYTEDKK